MLQADKSDCCQDTIRHNFMEVGQNSAAELSDRFFQSAAHFIACMAFYFKMHGCLKKP